MSTGSKAIRDKGRASAQLFLPVVASAVFVAVLTTLVALACPLMPSQAFSRPVVGAVCLESPCQPIVVFVHLCHIPSSRYVIVVVTDETQPM